MAHLLRIVMIHGHLNGVVELSVDGHTNICGTNASGKTTLQRLVPVFYGELPNKVVPKTRMKFDAFYLPNRNSYLVYEYRREAGNVCQAVLTRKQEGGVEYRFVGAPYRPEDYLVETEQGPLALDYTQWASGLRRSGTPMSPKLGATSEFRSVIQNDFTQLHGNSRDGLKLRQIAAQFSLVNPERRIRHIEKLVSAVHAKEGKMDTLKTMLAAIFEEDGVELPVTRIRSAKAREWIHQMRQSMRLEPLQAALAKLSGIDRELAELDTTLWQLKPQLAADREQAQRQVADLEGELNRHQREFQAEEQAYGERRDALNDQHSEVASQLQHTQHRLNDLQTRFEQYADADMPGLERDINALPQWREQRDQLQQHLQVMQDAVKESQARLDGRLRELSENLARQTQENQELIDALVEEKAERREQQWQTEQQHNERYQQARQRGRCPAGPQRGRGHPGGAAPRAGSPQARARHRRTASRAVPSAAGARRAALLHALSAADPRAGQPAPLPALPPPRLGTAARQGDRPGTAGTPRPRPPTGRPRQRRPVRPGVGPFRHRAARLRSGRSQPAGRHRGSRERQGPSPYRLHRR